jgi:hypothetical protein
MTPCCVVIGDLFDCWRSGVNSHLQCYNTVWLLGYISCPKKKKKKTRIGLLCMCVLDTNHAIILENNLSKVEYSRWTHETELESKPS